MHSQTGVFQYHHGRRDKEPDEPAAEAAEVTKAPGRGELSNEPNDPSGKPKGFPECHRLARWILTLVATDAPASSRMPSACPMDRYARRYSTAASPPNAIGLPDGCYARRYILASRSLSAPTPRYRCSQPSRMMFLGSGCSRRRGEFPC